MSSNEQLGVGTFSVRVGSRLITVDHWDKLPEKFDHLICFDPKIPDGPHTSEDHELISLVPGKFKELLDRQSGSS